ncbi:MAG: hypothetical protein RBS16_06195 [Candidatus Cloacimonadales bacterium]|nr:hypothetical protein [Candidatus Cloacimonadota bacterium]MDD3502239.1 hypothetical protein [Candidatus Cloacimonadota bacterium]MDX9977612.1 hypothetical protein [Candidatus Cloacimonadales bacterium]
MKKKTKLLILFLILLFVIISSCSHKSNPLTIESMGDIPLQMSLSPAYQMGYNVSRVFVKIRNQAYQDSMNLRINADEQTAQGTFYDLIPGLYNIDIKVYDDTLLIATGSGQGQVIPGQNTIIHIRLQMLTGDLTIEVDWGDLFLQVPKKILFIGNSYTYANEGLWECVKQMILSAHPDWNVETAHVSSGGFTLEDHYQNQQTLTAINSAYYDLVILQEQSTRPVYEPELFYLYATKLDSLIRKNNGKTAFYMTHARKNIPDMIDDLSFAYNYIGNELNALVCPAGLAWEKSRLTDPLVNLYENDGSHPNFRGSYLNACVIYASIFHESPVGNSHVCYYYMTEADIAYLQNIAWQTVCEYFNWDE